MKANTSVERCIICDEPTGRSEDSNVCDIGVCDSFGPFCDDCFAEHKETHQSVVRIKASGIRGLGHDTGIIDYF